MIKKIQNNFNNSSTTSFKAKIANEEQIMRYMEILKIESVSPSVFFPEYFDKLKTLKGDDFFKYYAKMTEKKAKLCSKIEKKLNTKLEEIKKFADDTFSVKIGRLVEDPNTTVLTVFNEKHPDYKDAAMTFYATPKTPVKNSSELALLNCVLDVDVTK